MSPTATVPLARSSAIAAGIGASCAADIAPSGRPRIANSVITQSVNFAAGGTRPRSQDSSRWVCALISPGTSATLPSSRNPVGATGGLPTARIVPSETAMIPSLMGG